MAELTPQERLQPSLLDRLRDDEPSTQVESRDKRILSMAALRESVMRDIGWLLNTEDLESSLDYVDPSLARVIDDCPLARASVSTVRAC